MTIPSHGTLLRLGDGGGTESFTTVAKIKDIDGPGFTRGTHDASTQTTDWGEVVPGLKRAGQVSFTINWIPTDPTHDHVTGLRKDFIDGTKRNIQIVWPDVGSTTDQFAIYITELGPTAPVDGILEQSCTMEVTGDPAPLFAV